MATASPGLHAAPRPERRALVSMRTLVGAALIVLAVVALFFLLQNLMSTVLVVVLAIAFAEGIRPLVAALHRRRIPEWLAILVVYLVMLGGLAGLVALLLAPIATQAHSLATNLPTYQKRFLDFVGAVESQLNVHVDISQQAGGLLDGLRQALIGVGSTFVAVVANFIVTLVVAFMWLISSAALKRFAVDLLPASHQEKASEVLAEVGYRMGGYLRGAAINGVVVGVATGVIAFLMRLPSPTLLGVFAGLIALVPVIGAVTGAAVPALVALTINPLYAVLVLAVMAVLQLADANIVVPVVMNRVVALPALGVVIALLIGGALAGVIGALLAVPVAAGLQVVVIRVLVPAVHRAEGRSDAAEGSAAEIGEAPG